MTLTTIQGYRTDVMQPYGGDRTASARVYSNDDTRRTYTDIGGN